MSENTTDRRSQMLGRLIMTLICFIAFEVVEVAVVLLVLFQYGHLLILGRRNENVRKMGNKLSFFAYKVLRYATLNENGRPFPFGSWPADEEVEDPVRSVHFN